jgi:hypothetical protein
VGESGNTEGTGEHLESRADHAALERKLREALRAHGFTSGPYARLVVLVYLTRAFEEDGYRLDLVKAHSQLSGWGSARRQDRRDVMAPPRQLQQRRPVRQRGRLRR